MQVSENAIITSIRLRENRNTTPSKIKTNPNSTIARSPMKNTVCVYVIGAPFVSLNVQVNEPLKIFENTNDQNRVDINCRITPMTMLNQASGPAGTGSGITRVTGC